mgnify:CR=1
MFKILFKQLDSARVYAYSGLQKSSITKAEGKVVGTPFSITQPAVTLYHSRGSSYG